MNSAKAYQELEALGVKVGAFKFKETVALSGPEGYLAIDYSKLDGDAHELEVLLHEIGHFSTGSFYQLDTPFTDREKQEIKATRFVFEKYYPPDKIALIMGQGKEVSWEIAEVLGLPEKFVREMLQFYREVRGVDFHAIAEEIIKDERYASNVKDVAVLLDEL